MNYFRFLGIGVILLCMNLMLNPVVARTLTSQEALRQKIVQVADELLETSEVSYVYGGSRLGEGEDCRLCNDCLEAKRPGAKERMQACPVCSRCSIDCSHFTQLVYQMAGLKLPYIDTATMLALSDTDLRQRFQLSIVPSVYDHAVLPGDLLVYKGHVVLLTKRTLPGRGDIVHATGGKDIRLPGQGIQRERDVPLASFRGPLLKVLRPVALLDPTQLRHPRIRPLPKK